MLWLSVIVLLPLAALVDRVLPGRPRRRSGTGHDAQAVAALRFTVLISLLVTAINVVMGIADRVGAGARRVPRQARGQRPDRPAVRAAHDRGRHRAAGALRATRSANKKIGVLLALLFVTLPFVVRAVQPVLMSWTARWRRRRTRWARRSSRRSAGSSCPTSCRRSCRGAGAGVRARDRRVRVGGADLGQHPVQHPGVVGVRLQADRVRQHHAARRRCPWSLLGRVAAVPGGPARVRGAAEPAWRRARPRCRCGSSRWATWPRSCWSRSG